MTSAMTQDERVTLIAAVKAVLLRYRAQHAQDCQRETDERKPCTCGLETLLS
jgi:ribosomal protein L29